MIENRLAVNSDYEYIGSLPHAKVAQESNADTPQNNTDSSDKSKFILPLENGSPEELNDMVDAMVISNKQAVNGEAKLIEGEKKESEEKKEAEEKKAPPSQSDLQEQLKRLKVSAIISRKFF